MARSNMPNNKDPDSVDAQRSLKDLLTGHLPLEAETAAFILVNVVDYLMTYLLLASGLFRESNPFAEFFLNHWGPIKGMLYYKLILVLFVCIVSQVIALGNLRTASKILNFGTVVCSIVVIYSLSIYLRSGAFAF